MELGSNLHNAIRHAVGHDITEDLLNEIVCSWFFEYDKPRKQKPKNNLKGIPERDEFQTPPFAVDLIRRFIPEDAIVWEWAAGEGNIVDVLFNWNITTIASDLKWGTEQDFFEMLKAPPRHTIKVTNVPFSIKYPVLKASYEAETPFIYLMPTDAMHSKTVQDLAKQYGLYVVMPDRRINFKTPVQGWINEKGERTTAQFHSAWFLGNFDWIKPGIDVESVPYPKYTHGELMERLKKERAWRDLE